MQLSLDALEKPTAKSLERREEGSKTVDSNGSV